MQRLRASSNSSSYAGRSARTASASASGSTRRRRSIAVAKFSRAPATGVWYYRVDVSVHQEALPSTFIAESDSDHSSSYGEDDSDNDSLRLTEVEYYSVLRRYTDFLELYEKTRRLVAAAEGGVNGMPAFPVKEYISPAMVGMLWRVSSSQSVLEERRAKFEVLLRWIENHPTARYSPAYAAFLGQPPQSQNGYVSLKEYTSPDFLSSLQQLTKEKQDRERRYTMDSTSIRSLLESSISDSSSASRRQRLRAVKDTSTEQVLGKRRERTKSCSRRSSNALEPKKMALPPVASCAVVTRRQSRQLVADQLLIEGQAEAPQPTRAKRKVARVEGSRPRKKQRRAAVYSDAKGAVTVGH